MRLFPIWVCVLLLVPAAAQATSVRIDRGTLRYSVSSGAQSTMTLTQQPGTIFVHDATAMFTASAPCQSTGSNDAVCPDPTVRAISISGSGGNDRFDVATLGYPATMSGNGGNDVFIGGLGRDRLSGGDGDDTLDGGPGPDRLAGGHGSDTITYAARTAGVSVSLDGRANDGAQGEGDYAANDVEKVIGGSGNDVLAAKTGAKALTGGPGDDVLLGGTGKDDLQGGDGNDRVDGGPDSDSMDGGAGRDVLDYSSRSIGATVNLAAGTATTFGESDRAVGFEDVTGGRLGDHITGDAGENRLNGGGGNDTLDGDLGPDVLIGGGGFDIASYASRTTPIAVSLEGTANDGAAGERDNVTRSVEGVIGGPAGDRLVGNSGTNTLRGGGGADRLVGGRARDVLDGGPGPDLLLGGRGADQLTGGAGRDTVRAGSGDDLVFTRDGFRDAALCGSGTDTALVDRRDRLRGCEHVRGGRR
jgi:Ca2+-binding RTX toxin-like protein